MACAGVSRYIVQEVCMVWKNQRINGKD